MARTILLAIAVTLSAGVAMGDEPQKPDAPSVWMQRKLNYSREILAGIASADFDKIAANAGAMNGLAKVEGFVRSRTPGYRTQLQLFQAANEEIIRQANRDDVEGVRLAFHQLVNSCVKCHEQLREHAGK
jgi:cytochrome c556